ncbi:MAG: trypsin-like peptidase domain-containing protein [Lachnospiraceae bacterium]|nr:trypsin-like peptidase domain-containing protein [Lachnospiraceae bacterium]
MNWKKWLVGILFLGSLLLTACGKKEDEPVEVTNKEPETVTIGEISDDEKTQTNLQQCILQVQTDTQLGSGVLWEKREDEWIVVTAAHVVKGLTEVDLYLVEEDKILQAKVTEVNGLDLAFLTVSTTSVEEAVAEKYSTISILGDSVQEKEAVLAAGYNPYGELCHYEGAVIDDWIYVEDFDNYMLLCDCPAQAGMSGGAVVTAEGCLAGLICGENREETLAVLPVGVIKSEYQIFQGK